jgi:Astacin (Peptidase family M12A)/Abnormal spindle-like microcephaly-assoc'd, ASPM-SPD-2-Hydin
VLRAWLRIAVSVLCLFVFGAVGGASFAQGHPPQGQPAPGQITQPTPTSSETHMGMWRGRPVTYQVINGRNIYEGDIILENVQPMPKAGQGGGLHSDSVGLVNSSYLWPKVNGVAQIPYVIDGESQDLDNVNSAISTYNSTFAGVIQLVPRTTQANYIDINLNGSANGVCEADEGDANNGEQSVAGASNCTIATILHEFGHVTGVWHEQSRTDAATYVTFNYGNVIKGSIGNFLPAVDNDQQNLTPYDFASVMEYPALSFSRNGGPPLDSIPPGMPLSNSVGYSAADVEGIMRLYGVAPTQVTVTSNPPGLQVMVDGSPVTTPMTYSWALNSTHTLAVATGVQTLNGIIVDSSNPIQPTTFYYTYGVWNDGGAQNHTITVTPGNGEAGFPSTAPQVATYSANFIQLVPYTPSVFPASSGTMTLTGTPSPQTLTVNGVQGTYVVARQLATLTASANSGYSFYEFNNAPDWLPGGLSSNPKTFYVPETGLTLNTTAEFTNTPVYTVDVTPNSFSSNLSVYVDGEFTEVPKNFSSFYDSGWTANSNHTLDFATPLQPFDFNTQFVFSTWTPGGTSNPLTITLPATSQSYIATLSPEYVPATNFNSCGGTGTITPASTISGGFYPSGTTLTYTETPSTNSGGSSWIFTGWSYDLTGTTPSEMLSPTDESLVYANFNTTNAPLTITSLSPSSVASGGSAFTLTINGTGFTPSGSGNPIEIVGFNFLTGPTFPVTFVSSTELQVPVPASAIASPGTFLLYVENYPSAPWRGCAVFAHQPFFVSQGTPSGATTVTATPGTLSFPSTGVDQTSPGQTITVKNTGTVATTLTVAASTNFGWSSTTCPVAPSTLAAGANCTITATFTPTTSGSLTGNISVTDSATNSPQTVALSGTATPATTTVTVTPTTYNFGNQAVGTTSMFQTFTVQNTGSAYTSIAISTTGNFAQVNNCGNLLDAGASCTINATFTPTVAGPLSGSISITDQATNSPQMVTLSGTGTSSGTVIVTVTPASETFVAQTVGTTSAAKTVTVKNTGTGSTSLSFAATGDFAAVSGGTTPCSTTLAAGSSCTISVTFNPTSTGTLTGTVSVTDSATNSPQMVKLTGTGKAPTVIVTPSPTSETFAAQALGTTSAAKTITVKNTGTGSTPITIAPASGDFAVKSTTCGPTLGASPASCTISVTFTPESAGALTGSISITDNAGNSPQTVSLTGTGKAGTVVVTTSPTSETFAAQTVGTTSAAKTVTVKNTGTASTPISIALGGDFAQTNTCGTTLGPSPATCTISVTFTPQATGTLGGSISVSDNGSTSPQMVKLSGTGKALTVVVTATPTSETFAKQAVGTTSASKTVTIKNTGTGPTSISFGTTGDFAETLGTCTGTLGPSPASCTVMVTFTPTATGSLTGTLTITDAATNSPQTVKLTGTGE